MRRQGLFNGPGLHKVSACIDTQDTSIASVHEWWRESAVSSRRCRVT